jgi:hypothetical protein
MHSEKQNQQTTKHAKKNVVPILFLMHHSKPYAGTFV